MGIGSTLDASRTLRRAALRYKQLKGAYALGRFGALWRTAALLMIATMVLLLYALFLFWMGSE